MEQEADIKKCFPISALCEPIGAAPTQYGDSPMKMDLMAPYPAGT
jgi:hypothetical protein